MPTSVSLTLFSRLLVYYNVSEWLPLPPLTHTHTDKGQDTHNKTRQDTTRHTHTTHTQQDTHTLTLLLLPVHTH